MAIEGDLKTIALAPKTYQFMREIQIGCYYNSDVHKRNSKIADHYTSAKFEYLAKVRSCRILPGEGARVTFCLRSLATHAGSLNTRNVATERRRLEITD